MLVRSVLIAIEDVFHWLKYIFTALRTLYPVDFISVIVHINLRGEVEATSLGKLISLSRYHLISRSTDGVD